MLGATCTPKKSEQRGANMKFQFLLTGILASLFALDPRLSVGLALPFLRLDDFLAFGSDNADILPSSRFSPEATGNLDTGSFDQGVRPE
jgi:hypothetical protein